MRGIEGNKRKFERRNGRKSGFLTSFGGQIRGKQEISSGRPGKEVISGQPLGRSNEVGGQEMSRNYRDDWLGWEVDGRDRPDNDTGDGFTTERDEDNLADLEGGFARIGQNTAVLAIDFSRNYLIKHRDIIPQNEQKYGIIEI